jgi:hypothetical protein
MNVEPPQRGFKTFLVLIALGVGTFFITQTAKVAVNTYTQAGATSEPKEVKITNVTDQQATITWLTDIPTTEYILYGADDETSERFVGTRDSTTHHLTLTNLQSNTTYYFRIGAGGSVYEKNDRPYEFKTSFNFSPPERLRVYGQVLDLKGIPAPGAIVHIQVKDADGRGSKGLSTTLSSITDTNGLFSMNLMDLREVDLSSPFYFSRESDEAEINVIGESGERVSTLLKTSQLQPVPILKLSSKAQTIDLRGAGSTQGASITLPNKYEIDKAGHSWFERILRLWETN